MQGSTRSTTSSAPPHTPPRPWVRVILLNKEQLTIPVEPKGKVQDVFNQVRDHLGLRESEYFGLAQLIDGEYRFTELEQKVQKLNPKGWKAHTHNADSRSQPLMTFYFRVQFYVDHVMLLRERVTRHLYYLQLRDNLLNYSQLVPEEQCFLLISYALQADQGNYNSQRHANNYFDPREYFPAWVLQRHGCVYLERSMPAMHRDLQGMSRSEAQLKFIQDVSTPPAAHNLIFYRLKKRKADPVDNTWLAICPRGVEIYEEMDNFKSLLSCHHWADIGKLHYDKKRFEIQSSGASHKMTYYSRGSDQSKYLLAQCMLTHGFQRTLLPKLKEIRNMEAEDRRHYKESYIYSDSKDLAREHESSKALQLSFRIHTPNSFKSPSSRSTLDPRYSVVSSTSSNTTSGIVSDRPHYSFDESEDDHSAEIMINTPPNKLASSFRGNSSRNKLSFRSGSPAVKQDLSFRDSHNVSAAKLESSFRGGQVQSTPAHSPPRMEKINISPVVTGITEAQIEALRPPSQRASVSRTSSSHSQRSQHSVRSAREQAVLGAPIAADTQIQRVTMAPTMMVSSTPLPPRAGVPGRALGMPTVEPVPAVSQAYNVQYQQQQQQQKQPQPQQPSHYRHDMVLPSSYQPEYTRPYAMAQPTHIHKQEELAIRPEYTRTFALPQPQPVAKPVDLVTQQEYARSYQVAQPQVLPTPEEKATLPNYTQDFTMAYSLAQQAPPQPVTQHLAISPSQSVPIPGQQQVATARPLSMRQTTNPYPIKGLQVTPQQCTPVTLPPSIHPSQTNLPYKAPGARLEECVDPAGLLSPPVVPFMTPPQYNHQHAASAGLYTALPGPIATAQPLSEPQYNISVDSLTASSRAAQLHVLPAAASQNTPISQYTPPLPQYNNPPSPRSRITHPHQAPFTPHAAELESLLASSSTPHSAFLSDVEHLKAVGLSTPLSYHQPVTGQTFATDMRPEPAVLFTEPAAMQAQQRTVRSDYEKVQNAQRAPPMMVTQASMAGDLALYTLHAPSAQPHQLQYIHSTGNNQNLPGYTRVVPSGVQNHTAYMPSSGSNMPTYIPGGQSQQQLEAEAFLADLDRIRSMNTSNAKTLQSGSQLERFKSLSALNDRAQTEIFQDTTGNQNSQRQRANTSSSSDGHPFGRPPPGVHCPVHSKELAQELQGLSDKNQSLPLLSALCSDISLRECTCNKTSEPERRLTASSDTLTSGFNTMLHEPGTMVRPFSWHSGMFEATMAAFDSVNLEDEPPYQNLPALLPHADSNNNHSIGLSTTAMLTNTVDASLRPHINGRPSNGMSLTSGWPTVTNNTYSNIPRKISSGGHSPNSSDTLHHHPNIGVA